MSILPFIIGSSLLVCIVSFSYIGYAFVQDGRPSDVPYELVPFIVPAVLGFANWLMVTYKLNPALVGAGVGLTLSIMGRQINLPHRWFGFENQNLVHPVAMILYALIFTFSVSTINRYVLPQQ